MKKSLIHSILLFVFSILFFCGCKDTPSVISQDTLELPTINSQLYVNNVSATTAEYGSIITEDKGQTITSRGICWSISINPTIKDSLLIKGSGIGSFSIQMRNLLPNTSYYVRAFATNATGTSYGGTLNFTTLNLVSVTTTIVSNIFNAEAKSGGILVKDGGISIISCGVCWSTIQNPTVNLTSKTIDFARTNIFTSSIVGLSPTTTYFVRAYVTTIDGTVYGQQEIFTTLSTPPLTGTVNDIDGNKYHYITIGTQAWMVENLRTGKYRNGDLIGTTSSLNFDITNAINPKFQWSYNGDESNATTYGRLYTWYASTDSRNIAPTGWHVASNAEWTTLQNYLITNGFNYDKTTTGNKIAKSMCGNALWNTYSGVGAVGYDLTQNNSSGLNFLPAGYRGFDGYFYLLNNGTDVWTSTEYSTNYAYIWSLGYNVSSLYTSNSNKNYGFSVRCLKD